MAHLPSIADPRFDAYLSETKVAADGTKVVTFADPMWSLTVTAELIELPSGRTTFASFVMEPAGDSRQTEIAREEAIACLAYLD